MKLFIMQYFLASHHFLPLKSSHPYKTAGKMKVLYILIFVYLNRRWKDKRF